MSLRFALLGLLAYGPKSGYDLKREFDASAAHAWNANSSQIYPTLAELKNDGLIDVLDGQPASRVRRNAYAITGAGQAELMNWLSEAAAPHTRRDPFLLRMFFLDLLNPVDQFRQLVFFVEEQERFLAMCDRYRAATDPTEPYVPSRLVSMEIAVAGARAQRDFVEEYIGELAARHPEVASLERARQEMRSAWGASVTS